MKYTLIIISFFVMISTIRGQDEWQILNEGFTGQFSNVDFINKDTGWTTGAKGLLKTSDGAETWNVVSDLVRGQFDFCNAHNGWAHIRDNPDNIEFGAGIFRTLDGGVNWFKKRNIGNIHDLCAVSDSVVYVLDIYDTIFKTVDGGTSWENISPDYGPNLRSLQFHSSDTGIVLADDGIIFRTFDGGNTWDSIYTGYVGRNLKLIDGSSGYFIARNDTFSLIYRTEDTFSSWIEIAKDTLAFLLSHFLNEYSIIALRSDGNWWGIEPDLIKSTDGGLTWEQANHMQFRMGIGTSIEFIDVDDVLYLFTRDQNMSFLLKSTDLGSNWKHLHLTFPMLDVHFKDRDLGFIGGSYEGVHYSGAFLVKTQDGGRTWDPVKEEYRGKIYFLNDSRGYNYGGGDVYTTTDGGNNWTEDTTMRILDIHSLNDSVSWLMEYDNFMNYEPDTFIILRTLDGGHTWDTIVKFGESDPWYYGSLGLIDENTACAVGLEGRILKFSENGEWERIESGTTLPLNKVVFVDQEYGLITGGYTNDKDFRPVILLTEDGGDHWTTGPEMPYLIHDLQFLDSLNGFAVGEDNKGRGVILETFDRGVSWIEVISGDDSLEVLRALHFKDNMGWAVGDNSQILKLDLNSIPERKDTASRFMVVADLHHYSPSPDLSQTMLYEFAMASIEEEVDFLFVPGDLIIRRSEDPAVEDSLLHDWHFVLDTLAHHNIRLYACRGNNDAGSGETWDALFSDIYQFPQNGPEGEKNLTYAIEYENMLFIALDQYTNSHQVNQSWLDEILDTTTREHIFAAGHEPAFKIYKSDCLGLYPEERNLFWESLTDAGAKAYFSGHAHFYDHTLIDDGDGNPNNDVHQVITGTGGGSFHPDAAYNGDNGRWTPQREYHEEAHGYVLVEIDGDDVLMTWKQRTGTGLFEYGGDSCNFSYGSTDTVEKDPNAISNDADQLFRNYPNPFQTTTNISYQLSESSPVKLCVYDVFGREVATVVNKNQIPGTYEVTWSAHNIDPGIYFCELRTRQGKEVIHLIVIGK